MVNKHGIGQISNGTYGLSANFGFAVGRCQLQQFVNSRSLTTVGQYPNRVQFASYSDPLLIEGDLELCQSAWAFALNRLLSITASEIAFRIELRQPLVN